MLSLQNRLWMKCIKFQNNRMIIMKILAYYENIVLSLFILHSNLNMILKSCICILCYVLIIQIVIQLVVYPMIWKRLLLLPFLRYVLWYYLYPYCIEWTYSLHSNGIVSDCNIWWENKCIMYRINSFSNITSSKEVIMFANCI